MIQTLKNAFKIKEIRNKILLTILLVIIYRIGCYIPVPGIEASVFSDAVEGNSFMGIMSAITGGALSQGTLFAIGISPYINASIIMQLLTVAIPALERLSKEGEEGKHKIAVITRYVTLGLAVVNAVGILLAFNNESLFDNAMFGASGSPQIFSDGDAADSALQLILLWALTVAVMAVPSEMSLLLNVNDSSVAVLPVSLVCGAPAPVTVTE